MPARRIVVNSQAIVFKGNKPIHVVLCPVNKSQSVIEPVAL